MWNSLLKTSFTFIQIALLSACYQVPNDTSLTGDPTTSNLASRSPSRNSDKCIDSSRCQSTCNEIYLRANALSSCYNLGENQVNDIFEVFETLKSPRRRSSLDGINVSDMKAYLKVDHNSLLDLVDPIQKDERRGSKDKGDLFAYSEDSAEYVLEWIADNEDIAQIFRAEDRGHEIIRELLRVYGSAGDAHRPVMEIPSSNDIDTPNYPLVVAVRFDPIPNVDYVNYQNSAQSLTACYSARLNLFNTLLLSFDNDEDSNEGVGESITEALGFRNNISLLAQGLPSNIRPLCEPDNLLSAQKLAILIEEISHFGDNKKEEQKEEKVRDFIKSNKLAEVGPLLGFIHDGFDNVSLISYAKSKDNEILVSLLRDVVEGECSSSECVKAYYCSALKKEGDEYYINEYIRKQSSISCSEAV